MGETWTRDRVMQVAPDAASAKAGEGLSHTRKWASAGRDGRAVWGECLGSGSKPYQVQIDLGDVAFKCSCPSRKFPCKHGVGLMLMYASGEVGEAEPPAWVTTWLASRAERTEKKSEKSGAIVTPEKQAERIEAQEGRRAKRMEKVTRGMEDLRLWLEDLVRSGMASAPGRGFGFFEERAKRLVDAQVPGAARMVRDLGSAASSGDGWQARVLEKAGVAYLLTEATARLSELPNDLREDVLATLGIPAAAETLDGAAAVQDVWQVIGREIEIEANLKSQWTYLFGLKTQRPALLLDFAYGNAGLDVAVPVGTLFPADLVFYPGQSLRASVQATTHDVASLTQMRGLGSIVSMLDLNATLLGTRPWLASVGVPLIGVRPFHEGGKWWLVDSEDNVLPLEGRGRSLWTALAISAGQPVSVGVATDGRTAWLLSIVAGGIFTDLAPPAEGVE